GADPRRGRRERADQAVILPPLPLQDAQALLRRWGQGSFDSVAASIRFHAQKHGHGAWWAYLRAAAAFSKHGARRHAGRRDGTIRYEHPNGSFIIERDGLIVSFGQNLRR